MLCGCGQTVLQVGDPPFLIDAVPHECGIWTADGVKLTALQVAYGVPGHHRHDVTAACGGDQLALFGAV